MITIENLDKIVGSPFRVGEIEYEFYSFNDYPGRYQYWFWIRNQRTGRESRLTLDRRDLTLSMDKMAGQLFLLNEESVRSFSSFVEAVERILNYHT
jgi:hypothetical protein